MSRFASWCRLVDTSVCITGTIYLALAVLMLCSSTPLGATLATCSDKALVTLDIGHTPLSPGALSARGRPEYGFNKALVSELAHALRSSKQIEVAILNEAGQEISLAQRAQVVHAIQRGILLSVHHDSVQEFYLENWIFEGKEQRFSNRFRGYSLFVSALNGQYEQSKNLAMSLGRKLRNTGFKPTYHHAENIPGERRPIVDHATGVFRFDHLAILKNARIPAVLFEAGVIVNQGEELELLMAETRKQLVEAITLGIESYCGSR